jgi:dTMP kinase
MLVTLEGLDGSGKTSCWEMLRDSDVVPEGATFTREPTNSWYGEAVDRSIADDDADPLAELFLYTADHAAHLADTVRPALDAGGVVVSDRYSDSRYAYQGVTLDGVVPDPMQFVKRVHQPWTRAPDATIYLDVDPETAAERSGATNKFETAAYLTDVRENYRRLLEAERERFVEIDATQSQDTVHRSVRDALDTLL